MANNSSSYCETYFWYPYTPAMTTACNYIITPGCFFLGLFGHTISSLSYYKQLKKDEAYLYQIFVAISGAFLVLGDTSWVVAAHWLWEFGTGPDWFQKCFSCMWYVCHLGSFLQNIWITITLLLMLSMSCDRLLAITKPNFYLNNCQIKHHFFFASICIFLGVITSIFDSFQSELTLTENGHYELGPSPYRALPLMFVLSLVRVGVRILATICLFVCNIILIYCYKRRGQKVGEITIPDMAKEKKRKEAETTLILLATTESFLTAISMSMHSSFFVMMYTMPTFDSCEVNLMAPLVDSTLQIGDMINFYLMLFLRPQFRQLIIRSMPCIKNQITTTNTVTVSGMTGQRHTTTAT